MSVILELRDIYASYGAIEVLQRLSLHIEEGEIVALLGANGAGKTTTLRTISRTLQATSGTVTFQGEDLANHKPHAIVKLGISHCPEGRRIFPDMSVEENLMMGGYCVSSPAAYRANMERAFHYFPKLADRRRQKGGTLSGGEQQMLAIGRALMSSPKLLMLDEPSLGLAPKIVDLIFEIITKINKEEGVSIFLVEQNANEALLHAKRAYILEIGTLLLSGIASDLLADPKVKAAYLGQ